MGEFDDVLAMELGDEWDLPHDEHASHLHPSAATLRLSGALVELRGELPASVGSALEALTHETVHIDSPALVTVVVEHDGAGWSVHSPSGHRRVDGSRADDLAHALFELLDELLVATDPSRLHLDVSCVELGGVGIAIAGGRDVRAATADELLQLGAVPVTERLLTVLPGSHTVFGYPLAMSPQRATAGRRWRPHTSIDVVAHVGGVPGESRNGSPAASIPLGATESCMRLLDLAVDRERLGSAALDVVASLTSGASHWEVLGEPGAVAAAVRAAPPPPRRAFVVVHRFDEVADDASVAELHGAPSLRVARVDDGAVALDGRTGTALSLTGDEVEALEELLVGRAGSKRASVDPRLERLAAHGMHVPDRRVRRPVPGVEAFGLPNCPSGPTARSMWGERRGAGTVEDEDGTAALAVLQGVVPGDEEQHRSAIEVHRRVQDRVVGVERQLLHTLSLLDEAGIDPIVLGSVVHAHDGLLPPYFAESEEIDLLVHDGELPAAVGSLEAAGYSRSDDPAGGDDARGVVDLVPRSGFGSPVRLRDTLGVGPFGALVDHEEFHRRAVPVRIHGRWCRSLHPEHRFVHACLRLEVAGDGSSTQHVRDVVLAAPRADVQMAEAMEASERWGATSSVTAAVRHVDGLLPGLSPWIVERSFRSDGDGDRRRGSGRRARRAVRRR